MQAKVFPVRRTMPLVVGLLVAGLFLYFNVANPHEYEVLAGCQRNGEMLVAGFSAYNYGWPQVAYKVNSSFCNSPATSSWEPTGLAIDLLVELLLAWAAYALTNWLLKWRGSKQIA